MIKEFFGGKPDFFSKILSLPDPPLSEKEHSFLNYSAEKLCGQSAEWDSFRRKRIGRKALNFARKEKFFGLSMPEKHGGLGFSAKAHALILQKIASAHLPLAVFISVSNSLGPARLLLRYGSEEQKKRLLPRLTSGKEIPCFALTEPGAGSDIASLSSTGVLFREAGGKGRLKLRLNWNKRWISLSAVASLAAIAVRLKDPDRLLGGDLEDLGVSLVLIPLLKTPGVKRGRIHDTLAVFMGNGPFQGENVIADAEESLIGGLKKAGEGWRMINESLSLGRGLSTPSLALGGMMRAVKTAALFARVREQFLRPVGEFEGVKECLARMAGRAFASSALRDFFVSDLSEAAGEGANRESADGRLKPKERRETKDFSAKSKNGDWEDVKDELQTEAALVKYSLAESHQQILKDGMDVLGGKGVSLGPKNSIALLHIASPIFNVVEGSNVLLRSFAIFRRAVFVNHPLFKERLKAARSQTGDGGLRRAPEAGGGPQPLRETSAGLKVSGGIGKNAFSFFKKGGRSGLNSWRLAARSFFRLTGLAWRACLLSLSRGFLSLPPRSARSIAGTAATGTAHGAAVATRVAGPASALKTSSDTAPSGKAAAETPPAGGGRGRFFDKKGRSFMRKLSWSAALFAFFAEIFLLRRGARFSAKESVCGRFADILSAQYRIAALLWRCHSKPLSSSEELVAEWAIQDGFYQIQISFERLIQNARPPFGFAPFKAALFFAARINALGAPPDDRLSMQTASALLSDSSLFRSLTEHIPVSKDPEDSLNKLEKAAKLKEQSRAEAQKLKLFSKENRLKGISKEALIRKALEKGALQKEEAARLLRAEQAAAEALQADAFSPEEYYPPESGLSS